MERASEASKWVSGASEWVNGQASGQILTSPFQELLNLRGLEMQRQTLNDYKIGARILGHALVRSLARSLARTTQSFAFFILLASPVRSATLIHSIARSLTRSLSWERSSCLTVSTHCATGSAVLQFFSALLKPYHSPKEHCLLNSVYTTFLTLKDVIGP